ncbi:MAG: family 20 glycosylhydrolase, partial [Lachnospiraceae bacterium]|nr:family 20 glycosylhydrolase [Lachnospiraceae bacterium]
MKDKKNYILAGGALLVVLAAMALVGALLRGQYFGDANPNLALKRGVKATCDSVEQEALSAAMAIDGNDTDRASRWSSENNREDASHYMQLEFPEEISVSFVVLKWERANAVSYALEASADGEDWRKLQSFETAPETLKQEIVLEEPVQLRYLRLSTYAVSKEEADFSDLYQNVSLYEFEVYGDKPTAYKLKAPVIETAADGARQLVMPETPEGFQVSLIGADLEQVIGADGRVYDTIQDKEVTVGYRVEDLSGREETREVAFTVEVPANDDLSGDVASDGEQVSPYWVVPSIAEWRGGEGLFKMGEEARIIVGSDDKDLWDVAALFGKECEDSRFHWNVQVCRGTLEDAGPGDIYLGYAEKANGLGEEGYTCDITDKCVIKAEGVTGIRWGTVTLLQILCRGDNAPQGHIRDYPLYEVRGFGIDVARKAVSLDTLYRMMELMSWYKMNDLTIHLNDNEILATSGLTASAEQAMMAESAFRLESSLVNEEGETLTSAEYAYTKEEFAEFIATARTYGVNVVPEIDTPAHSLSITKLYPEYALRTANESVDQIDLGNEEAVALVEGLWKEMLDEENGAFREAQIIGIGMDEYYGDGEQYRQYLTRINDQVQETGKTVRLWGSLSNMGGTTKPLPENLQMNIWSTLWADPR